MDSNLGPARYSVRAQGKSFTNVVRQEQTTRGESSHRVVGLKRMKISIDQLDVEWLKGACVGHVHEAKAILLLQKRLEHDGFPQCSVRYIGGDLVLISSLNANLLHSAVLNGDQRLAKWLAYITPWKGEEVALNSCVSGLYGDVVGIEEGLGPNLVSRIEAGAGDADNNSDRFHVLLSKIKKKEKKKKMKNKDSLTMGIDVLDPANQAATLMLIAYSNSDRMNAKQIWGVGKSPRAVFMGVETEILH
ncbi:hypothetical protein Ancab_023944 [Ancistrocladus abbreviatus]